MAIVTSREKRSIEELTIVLLCLKKALVLKHCRNCATRRCFALTIVFCVLSTGTAGAHGILGPDPTLHPVAVSGYPARTLFRFVAL